MNEQGCQRSAYTQGNLNFLALNLLGGVLDAKLEAEKYLRSSGLKWTIVRPGGLSNENKGNLCVSAICWVGSGALHSSVCVS